MCFLFNNKNEIGTQMAHSKRILFRRNEGKKEGDKQLKKKTIERRAWENLWTGRKKDREEKESFFHSTFFKVMKGRMEKLAA
jgi:hypothetical protein